MSSENKCFQLNDNDNESEDYSRLFDKFKETYHYNIKSGIYMDDIDIVSNVFP